jgi:hypothetical protein
VAAAAATAPYLTEYLLVPVVFSQIEFPLLQSHVLITGFLGLLLGIPSVSALTGYTFARVANNWGTFILPLLLPSWMRVAKFYANAGHPVCDYGAAATAAAAFSGIFQVGLAFLWIVFFCCYREIHSIGWFRNLSR